MIPDGNLSAKLTNVDLDEATIEQTSWVFKNETDMTEMKNTNQVAMPRPRPEGKRLTVTQPADFLNHLHDA